jgi:CRP-like cAMP-binding protein
MGSNHIPAEALSNFRFRLKDFLSLEDPEWDLFIQHLKFKGYSKKAHFVVEGQTCDYLAFIARGSVRYYHIKDGNDLTTYFSFENEFLSSYKSFLTRQPGFTYIEALEPTDLILISYQDLQLMLAHPALAYKMERFGRLMAEYYVCCYEERVASFLTETPEERYLKMLQTSKDVMQRIPQHFVANYLGVTPVSLSRIKRRLLVPAR